MAKMQFVSKLKCLHVEKLRNITKMQTHGTKTVLLDRFCAKLCTLETLDPQFGPTAIMHRSKHGNTGQKTLLI